MTGGQYGIQAAARQRLAKRIVIVAACLGVALTAFAPKGSVLYDLGTMLIVATLVIGSMFAVYFAKKRAPVLTAPPSFAPDAAFEAHVQVRVAPTAGGAAAGGAPPSAIAFDADRYFLLLGAEGFSVRFRPRVPDRDRFDAQFLRPEAALARFVEGTVFRVYDGAKVVAEGEVVQRL